MLLLVLAAIAGGILTCIVLWPVGILLAILGAPVGGSLAAGLAGLLIALRRSSAKPSHAAESSQSASPAGP